jgi:hypothetical protein
MHWPGSSMVGGGPSARTHLRNGIPEYNTKKKEKLKYPIAIAIAIRHVWTSPRQTRLNHLSMCVELRGSLAEVRMFRTWRFHAGGHCMYHMAAQKCRIKAAGNSEHLPQIPGLKNPDPTTNSDGHSSQLRRRVRLCFALFLIPNL